MKSAIYKYGIQAALICILLLISQCRFTEINQPKIALPGEMIQINLKIGIDNPESNPHKGVLCLLLPQDWTFLSANYSSPIANGTMDISPAWSDSAQACYPAEQMNPAMHWMALLSDSGYTYEERFTIDVAIDLQVGEMEGCFYLGYIITKATQGLICSGVPQRAPFYYPHPVSVSSSGQYCDTLAVDPAPEWDNLFNRTSGWTGADGIYSMHLSGVDVPQDTSLEKTLLLFSDTFIGEVNSNNQRIGSMLVNNTYALLDGTLPLPEKAEFFWATDSMDNPTTLFVPTTPNTNPGDWYWLMDGVATNDSVYIFGLRLEKTNTGFGFKIVGVSLITYQPDANQQIQEHRQVDTPLYYENLAESWEIVLGQAVMPLTTGSGNPDPDGYIYVYGPKNMSGGGKDLVVSRVLPDRIGEFSEWRFWDGSVWSTQIENSASLTSKISQEFSVSPLGYGKYILVFQLNENVGIRVGDSPVGPFGPYYLIYQCPEVELDPDIFVYNAKAHPHLSPQERLLISYNVNTFDFWDHFSNADIYRPRFIYLHLDDLIVLSTSPHRNVTPQSFVLNQNYPNPFNHQTVIEFNLNTRSRVVLQIYNVLGQMVKTLLDDVKTPGSHRISWDGNNSTGEFLSSGVYIFRLQVNEKRQSRKMILLK
jgi:hypothetical protein